MISKRNGECMDEKLLGLLITLFLGVFILIGAFISFLVKEKDKFIDFVLALAFSVILMLLFTDLMPEASEKLGFSHIWIFILFVIIGIVILRVLDTFIPDHEEEKMTKRKEKNNLAHIGIVASIALIIHNIIEGMAVYSTCATSLQTGLMISLGVGCHNLPLGIVVTTTIYQNNKSKKKTILMILGLMLSTFCGGLIMFFMNGIEINDTFLGILLSITIGMLIYICSNELYPRIRRTKNKKMTICGLVLGIILIAITCFF